MPGAKFTAQEYGPELALAVWEARYENPLQLVSNLSEAEGAVEYYRLRFRIEYNVPNKLNKKLRW